MFFLLSTVAQNIEKNNNKCIILTNPIYAAKVLCSLFVCAVDPLKIN